MVLNDYGQAPACSPPGDEANYQTTYYDSAVYFLHQKWIDADYLNHHGTKRRAAGSKALVGIHNKTGRWNIIRLCEVV